MAKHQFIIDEEIDLFAKQGDGNVQKVDLLNTATYVNTLTDCVMSVPEDKPFTIGLFGEWGSGKSSIIRTFKGLVAKRYESEGKKVKVITYDAWKYANDSFRRMFLLQMQQELGFKRETLMNKFYLNSSEDAHIDTRFDWRTFWTGAIVILLAYIGIVKFTDFQADGKILATAIVSLCALGFTIIHGLFREVKVNIQRPHLFAPEQFEECFNEMCEKAHHKEGTPLSYLKWIKCEVGEEGLDRLVIVIDNVDRCSTDLAYELLTNIKNFLGCKHNTIFIIPVDEESLKKHLIGARSAVGRESDEFLRKFFNICIRIKPFLNEEMYDFASGINTKYNLGLEPTTISLVANEFASNPRRIIQMFNNLLVELDSLPEEISKNHQALVCKMLIIREEYPVFYQKLRQDPSALFDLKALEQPTEKEKEKHPNLDNTKYQPVLKYLKATTAVTAKYESDYAIFEKILFNSNIFESIPDKVRTEFKSMEYNGETVKFVEKLSQRQDLMHYALKQLETAIHRGLWETDVKTTFDRILALNDVLSFSQIECFRLSQLLSTSSFSQIAKNLDKLDKMICFAGHAEKQGAPFFANWLVSYLIAEYSSNYRSRCEIRLACKQLSAARVDKLEPVILKAIENDDEMLEFAKEDFNSNKEHIFTDKFIGSVLNKIDSDRDTAISVIYTIAQKLKYSGEQLSSIIEKYCNAMPEYNVNSNNSADMQIWIDETTKLLNICEPNPLNTHLANNLDALTKKIIKETQVSGRVYNQTIPRSFIIDNQLNDKTIESFLDYFNSISRQVQTKILPPKTLETIATYNSGAYRGKIFEVLTSLQISNYPVENYKSTILTYGQYDSNHLQLLEYLLIQKKGSLNEETIKQILNELLEKIKTGAAETIALYIQTIIKTANDESIKNILVTVLLEKDKEWLLSLPKELLQYAVSAYEAKLDDYKDNDEVLSLLAAKGKKSTIHKIVQIAVSRLHSGSLSVYDLHVVQSFSSMNDTDKKLLKDNLSYAKDNYKGFEDEIDKCIKHIDLL